MRAVVAGLANIEAGCEVSWSEAKAHLGLARSRVMSARRGGACPRPAMIRVRDGTSPSPTVRAVAPPRRSGRRGTGQARPLRNHSQFVDDTVSASPSTSCLKYRLRLDGVFRSTRLPTNADNSSSIVMNERPGVFPV